MLDPALASNAAGIYAGPLVVQFSPHSWEFGYVPDLTKLQVGDIFLFRAKTPTFVHRRITAVQREFGIKPAHAAWTHVAIHLGYYETIEAVVRGGVRKSNLLDRSFGSDLILTRRLKNFAGLGDGGGTRFSTSLEVQQRIALEAASRIGQKYRWRDAISWFLYSSRKGAYARHCGAVLGPGAVCSSLATQSIVQACGVNAAPNTGIKRPTFPGDLAASDLLVDVDVDWVRLEPTSG